MTSTPRPDRPAARHDRKRVFVHIGAPKTGTTFIQSVLWANRERLAEAGFLYPYERRGEHFGAMLDLRQLRWGGHPDAVGGRARWDTVAARAQDWSGHTVLLTNEILGGATPAQIDRLVRSVTPAEVHVIFTARDFARQLVSDWQEHIKHQHTITLENFVDDLVKLGRHAPAPFGEMFWGLHDAAHVLPRWADAVSRGGVHLITVPQPGTPPTTLWERFCSVVDLPPQMCSLDVDRTNESLGMAEAELLRLVNAELPRMPPDSYDALVRRRLVPTLAGRSSRLVLPEHHLPWVVDRSEQLIATLAESSYSVVGDLQELRPAAEHHTGYIPTDRLDADVMLNSAVLGMANVLGTAVRQRDRLRRLKGDLGLLPDDAYFPEVRPRRPGAGEVIHRARSTLTRWRLRRDSR